jgi:hypothetical protein
MNSARIPAPMRLVPHRRLARLLSRVALAAGALVLLPAAAQRADRLDDYSTRLAVSVQGEGPWYRLPLPLALRWQAAHPDLRDLRVFNADGEALAYGFVETASHQTREDREHAVKWFPLRGPADAAARLPGVSVQRSGDGTVIQVAPDPATPPDTTVLRGWLLDASGIDAPLQRLRLDWDGGDGFQHFRIEASDDLQQWRSWGTGQVARLAFGGDRVARQEVDLPGAAARYLRLTWESPREAPGLRQAVLTSTQRRVALPALDWSDPILARRNGDTYEASLPAPTVLETLRVSLYQPNMLAPVAVSALAPVPEGARRQAAWAPVARGLLYRLVQDGQEILNHDVALPPGVVQALRVQVDERGGGLGDAVSFRVAARGVELVFLARGTPPYTLAMGRGNVQSAQLPLATLVPGYQPDRLARMGTAQAAMPVAPRTVTPAPVVSHTWKKAGLWAVLVLGVVLLGLMALSLLKSSRKP